MCTSSYIAFPVRIRSYMPVATDGGGGHAFFIRSYVYFNEPG